MNEAFLSGLRILAVDPASRGLGYVSLEDFTLIEWGFRSARDNKDVRTKAYVNGLIARYEPEVLILERYTAKQRSLNIQDLAEAFSQLAQDRGVPVCRILRAAVRATFGATNKYDIAAILAAAFPEIKPWCPPRRKIWKSEDPRINMFDALALACTYRAQRSDQGELREAA